MFTDEVLKNQEGLALNWTYQFLLSVESVKLLGEKLQAIKKALAILVIIKVDAVEESYEKTKYIFISHTQNAGKNTTQRNVINIFKLWKITNIWERH
jgi:hypothetical protein